MFSDISFNVLLGILLGLVIGGTYSYVEVNQSSGLSSRLLLNDYQLEGEPIVVKGVSNLSGVTWNKETNTLFAINNNPEQILELSLSGELLRMIELKGFQDTESIVWLGENEFAVTEERKSQLVFLTLEQDQVEIKRQGLLGRFIGKGSNGKNNGLEGVAADIVSGEIFLIKEHSPKRIYQVNNVDILIKPQKLWWFGDFSGLHYDDNSGNLLLLSHESHVLVELNQQGQIVSRLSLSSNSSGLAQDVPQAEGITVDGTGDIYIVSEPNLLYRFRKTSNQQYIAGVSNIVKWLDI